MFELRGSMVKPLTLIPTSPATPVSFLTQV
jgi:hypothetical protein